MDGLVTVLLILIVLVSVIYLYNWIHAISETKETRSPLMFFNWFYLFDSDMFNPQGNRYRRKALACMLLLVVLVVAMGKTG